MPRDPQSHPALSHSPPNALPLLCSSRPNASVAAARHHRGHRHPGDALRCPRAPPSTPLPPRRAVQRRTPPSASTPSSSTSRRRRSPSPPRLLRPLPEPTDQPCGTAVSSSAVRPFFPSLRTFPSASAAVPEARRRRASSPAWLEPPQLESEHTAVLRELPGARSAHQPLLPCTIAPSPLLPELRPPPRARLRRTPATPAPPVGSSRCARARATSWCPWRVDPSPLA